MIEKLQFLRITGPKYDIDRINEKYLMKYDIHLENAMNDLAGIQHVKPFVEVNPYKDQIAKAENLIAMMGEQPELETNSMELETAIQIVEEAYGKVKILSDKKESLEKKRKRLQQLEDEIEPFRLLDYELHKILDFKHIAFRFGRIANEYFMKFERYGYDHLNTVFYECDRDENFVWGVYFAPASKIKQVDAVYTSLHFEQLYIADEYEGTPEEAYQHLSHRIKRLDEQVEEIENNIRKQLMESKQDIFHAYSELEIYLNNFGIRRMAACTKEINKGSVFYILCGWMNKQDAKAMLREMENDAMVFCLSDENLEELGIKPPTKLKNPKFLKPFEMFVKMYGLPAYTEMDPTLYIALTYTLIFGIMFGDVGQGLVLVIGGFLIYKFKKMPLAGIISVAGLWSTFFGFMYGSLFGAEEILKPIWRRPMDNIMSTLSLSVLFGVVIIIISMILHIINAIKERDVEALLFDQSGVAGLLCYGTVVVAVLLVYSGHPKPAGILLAILIGLPLIAIMLKEPLGRIIKRKRALEPGTSVGMFLVEALVEVFDVVLSYATNTISFVRIGAFALSHAGMMGVVFTLAGAEHGTPNILAIILGNILVTGLEGLVVGIQVLRLEYYEMFSRFYKGSGKEFKAFRDNKENN